MKRWRNTILLALGSAVLALTAHWWVPRLLPFLGIVFKNKETVGTFKDFIQIVTGILTLALPLVKALAHKKKKAYDLEASHAATNSPASRYIQGAGDNQSGGINIQGNIIAASSVVGGDKGVVRGDAIGHDKDTAYGGDVVKGDKHVHLPVGPTPLTPLHQLPPPPDDFTGRETELRELRTAIEEGGVHISGLQGQGGVGKTALALKLAAELAPNFPDAQIYLDLKGVSEKPLTAAEAMSHVLRSFHPEAKLPEKEDDLGNLYRSVLHGKRVILLMDNAKDAGQVRPLVSPPNCALLITSRHHFLVDGLHARNLDTLPPLDARDFLLRITPRVKNEADAIARLCGYLPQALRLAATAIAEQIDLSPSSYLDKLADEKHRLRLLRGEEESVGASITLSYHLLDSQTQKRWRMLEVFPDTFDVPAAAAVWESEIGPAREALSHLLKFSMLEWSEPTGRYRLHDLMRAFAREQSSAADSAATAFRHATWYGSLLSDADNLYSQGGNSIVGGLALFDVERGNIQSGQRWAADHSAEDANVASLCSDYPDRGTHVLLLRQHPRERIRWREAALIAARQLKARSAEAHHLGDIGQANVSLCNYRCAIEYHEKRLAIAIEIGDRRIEGQAQGDIGVAHSFLGEIESGINYYKHHMAAASEVGDRHGEENALRNLGIAYCSLGEFSKAIEYHQRHLTIAREERDRREEGRALANLGVAYQVEARSSGGPMRALFRACRKCSIIGPPSTDGFSDSSLHRWLLADYRRALAYYSQNLSIAREIGDRQGEGNALGNLGNVYGALYETDRAVEYYQQAVAIADELGDRRLQSWSWANLGIVHKRLGDCSRALEYYGRGLMIAREIGDRQREGATLWNMSLALYQIGKRNEAISHAEASLRIREEIKSRRAEKVRTQLEIWRNG